MIKKTKVKKLTKQTARARIAKGAGGGKKSRKGKTVGVYVNDDMQEPLLARTNHADSRSSVITRDLRRYYTLLRKHGDDLQRKFTPEESKTIAETLKGVSFTPETMHIVAVSLGEKLAQEKDTLPPKGQVHKARREWLTGLQEKIADLEIGQMAALLDATERFWLLSDEQRSAVGHVF